MAIQEIIFHVHDDCRSVATRFQVNKMVRNVELMGRDQASQCKRSTHLAKHPWLCSQL